MGKDLKGKELGEGLCQIKDGRYVGRYTDRYGKRRTIYGKKLKETKEKLNRALYENQAGRYEVNSGTFTLNDMFLKWFEYKRKRVKNSTLGLYENQYYNTAKERIGDVKLTSIDTELLQKVFNELSERVLASTLKTYKTTLSNIFNYAKKLGYIDKNPVTDVTIQKGAKERLREIDRKKNHFLTQEQVKCLMAFAERKHRKNLTLYKLILLTGLRCGEAIALTWDDIDFENKAIRISKTFSKVASHTIKSLTYTQTPKTQSSVRCVPMCAQAERLLAEHRGSKESGDEFVFLNRQGKPYKGSSITVVFRQLIESYNKQELSDAEREGRKPVLIPENSLHSLRHTFATRCFENEVSPKVVQQYMGHSSMNMTMDLYTHVSNERLHRDIERIDDTV